MAQTLWTILGCGTSTGVPLIHCSCRVCRSRNPKNHRLRSSAWIQLAGTRKRPARSFLIDTGPDLRQQALRARIPRIDAVFYTHPHADHAHGIDELRSFNYAQKASIPLYGNPWVCTDLREKFDYIFRPGPVEGGGIPLLSLNQFDPEQESLEVQGVRIVPLAHSHGSKQGVGYRIDSIAYLTDTSYIPDTTLNRLRDLEVLVLDCLRLEPHRTHLNLDRALEVVSELRPKKTYLTHLGHDFDYGEWSKKLPRGVALAYDGLKIKT